MKNLVRGVNGDPLLCCWDDCGQYGDDREKEVAAEGQKTVHYVFCSPGHRAFWRNSVKSYGNKASGDK